MKTFNITFVPKYNNISEYESETIVSMVAHVSPEKEAEEDIVFNIINFEITRSDGSTYDIEEEELDGILNIEDLEDLYEAIEESYCFNCVQE